MNIFRMSLLMDAEVDNLYQAQNPLALVLQRGAAEYDINWDSEIDVSSIFAFISINELVMSDGCCWTTSYLQETRRSSPP